MHQIKNSDIPFKCFPHCIDYLEAKSVASSPKSKYTAVAGEVSADFCG
jgi:hypothetical protein